MSKQTVNQLIQRAVSDAAFRRELQRDPASALAGFDLSKDERAAITSGDPTRLTALGVDQRMSKAFGLGNLNEVSKVVVSDPASAGGASLIDEISASGAGALVGPGTTGAGSASLVAPDGTGLDAGLISGDSTTSSVIVGDPAAGAAVGSSTGIAPDGTAFDAGAISGTGFTDVGDGSASAFEPADASGAGTAAFDAGATTGGLDAVDPSDLSGNASALDEASGGLDTGGDIHPTEY